MWKNGKYGFGWVVGIFLQYLESWKTSTLEKMATYEGFGISVLSHIDVIKFLLEHGSEYVLSERFTQDVLKDYFEHQRSQGQLADNPSASEFGDNDLTIAAQRDIAPVVRGSVGGRYEKKVVCCE